jgi:hypothetical protein
VAGYSNNLTLVILVAFSFSLSLIGMVWNRFFDNSELLLFWIFILILFSLLYLINFSWKILKIARYIKTTKIIERRMELKRVKSASFNEKDQIKTRERRSGTDRRHIPTEDEVEKFYKRSGGLLVRLLTQSAFSKK